MAPDIATVDPPPNWKRTRRLLVLLAVVVIAALAYTSQAEPILDCLGDTADLDHVTVQVANRNRPMSAAQLEALARVDGDDIWLGYAAGGWDFPPGFKEMEFTRYWIFGKREGVRFWVILYVGAEWSYGFTFSNTEVYADSNGEHLGQHPCYAFEVDERDVIAALAGYYITAGH